MKHHNANRKFGRVRNQRTALLRSLAFALLRDEKIQTTEAKAKELRPYIEKMITRGKKDTLANRRLIEQELNGQQKLIGKLFTDIGPRYKERAGGYTRITKLGGYVSDGRSRALIELV